MTYNARSVLVLICTAAGLCQKLGHSANVIGADGWVSRITDDSGKSMPPVQAEGRVPSISSGQ